MKTFKIVFCLFVFISSLYSKDEIKFGLFYKDIFSSKKEAEIGTNLWLSQMEESYFDTSFKVIYYENREKLLNDYEKNKILAIIAGSSFYYKDKKRMDALSRDKWVLSRNDNMFEQFYLIKNSKAKIDLKNLKNKNILYKEEIARIWFKTLLLKEKVNTKIALKESKKIRKSKRLILDVFFKPNTISIVGKDLYDSMVEINPQIKEKIEIIAKSEAIFVRGIGFSRKTIENKKLKMLLKVKDKINSSDTNFEVISFIQVQNIFMANGNELEKLEKFYKEYFNLKKVHK